MSKYTQVLFQEIDIHKKGFISKEDIEKYLKTLNYPIIPNQIKQIFIQADTNKDGKITIDEFEILFND